ncbi:enoyl-CoA hydratase/isomerase family protein [Roseibium denhamense]|uniref:3-hydroxyisobutyryl-CoA hydrolase n=1 Tax=Roseibium denhamense TaxID=76305 RepID=A0ABY1NYF0_9HYPH|nr:enoyl-CoA hydratase/isomerase family protein [Roseibium denhamense]MTI04805.1 enoyl-CoA hydratase/isomerase family protein [Roseibium denhamense]SMP19139.1 enoyl-CoA hydratase [Roseibium denhamense]
MTDHILFEQKGHAGFITLNRPKALNALNHAMVTEMAQQLQRWAGDPAIAHVVIKGAGDKAFCAGGDIRSIYDARQAGETDGLSSFFRDEYLLNAQIKAYPKPFVALINGIVMGGGVGVSVHGSHRIGTEKMTFAMPETGIGFFPDVGGTYFLPRMPKQTGVYCALSAGRMKQADALATGILTHAVSEQSLGKIEAALRQGSVDEALEAVAVLPEEGSMTVQADLIERCFSKPDVFSVLEALESEQSDFAQKAAETIRQKSPTSVLLAFEQMKRGQSLAFNECMKLEYRIVSGILKGDDFFEGVRAVIVDKDHAPSWRPDTLEKVDSGALASYFEAPDDGDLPLS